MKVKTYKAMDMQEAIRMIKQDLGPQAVILSTRKVVAGKRAFGLFGRPMVEVTAALDGQLPVTKGPPPNGAQVKDTPGSTTPKGWEMVWTEIQALRKEVSGLVRASPMPNRSQNNEIERGLGELRWWISFLARQWGQNGVMAGSKKWMTAFHRLIQQGVKESHALRILERFNAEWSGAGNEDQGLEQRLVHFLKRLVQVHDPLANIKSRPLVLALVGPTGVGKTTTVAKLAAQCTLEHGRKVGLITNDTYRIAAVEQLRTYARIMRIPLEVVLQPSDLPQVINGFSDKDLVLMDTAGRSPFDTIQMGELKTIIEVDARIQSLLLVSATTEAQGLERVIKRFSPLRPIGLIGTKLDEATKFGPLFSVALQSRLPFAYFTTGQRVPEDIRQAAREDAVSWTLWGLPPFYQQKMAATGGH